MSFAADADEPAVAAELAAGDNQMGSPNKDKTAMSNFTAVEFIPTHTCTGQNIEHFSAVIIFFFGGDFVQKNRVTPRHFADKKNEIYAYVYKILQKNTRHIQARLKMVGHVLTLKMHTYIHKDIHTYIHTYIHNYIHTN